MSHTRGRPTETDDEARAQPPSRRVTSSQPQASLEIRLAGGAASRRLLAESHVVIGRIPGVDMLLDHHTVSRRHAEMFCDPFGRFWIRDLGSTNGTFVGEDPVSERVLSPGDRIGIGDFTLTFDVERPDAPSRDGLDLAPIEDDQPTAIRTLLDLEPPRISAGHLRTLLELSRRLIAVPEPRDRVDALAELVVRSDFHGLMAVVLRSDGRKSRLISRPRWCGGEGPLSPGDARQLISRRVLETLQTTREPLLATNAQIALLGAGPPSSSRFAGNSVEMSLGGVGELYVIAVPFRLTAESFDALYVTVPRDCWTAEWLNLYALAVEVYMQGEATWTARMHEQAHKAIEHELETARQIQRGLLPAAFSGDGLDVAVGFQPCKWVGGDYVDVVPLPSERVLLAVADVCGKGLQAAMVGSSLHTMVRASADADPPLTELVERVNRHLCEWLPEHSFVTMVAAIIDPATGAIECVNAGHPPMVIVRADGGITELQAAENAALGIADTRMASQRAHLDPGDVLAMYTDGLSELTNAEGEMLGHERLAEELSRICEARREDGVAAVGKHLDVMLDAFRGGGVPTDDRTYLLAQRR